MGCCNQPMPQMPIGVNPPPYPGPPMGPCPPRPPMPPVPPVPPRPGQCALPCDQTVFRRVIIPSTMGDDTTLPPDTLEYRNVILEYEFNNHVYIYSSDGIPTLISNGTGTNFNDLTNRPMYNGKLMTGLTNIPEVPTKIADLSDAARITCIESTNQQLKQAYNVLNESFVTLTQTVDTQGDDIKNIKNDITNLYCSKQDTLVSGVNIKTLNGFSLLGQGDLNFAEDILNVQDKLVSGVNIKTINGQDILGEGDLEITFDGYTKDEADEKYVPWTPYGSRKTIELANYDSLSGLDTTGEGHNLAMVSKWDVADFGAKGLHLNLNTKDAVTVNDKDTLVSSADVLPPEDFETAWNS